eukprot:10572443-Lingulodinium_polyedra.AAC.1
MADAESVPREIVLPDAVAGVRSAGDADRAWIAKYAAPAVRSGLLRVALGCTRAGRLCDWRLCPVAFL